MHFKDVNDILDFAIRKEEEAREFYLDLAGKSTSKTMRKVFEDFSREEEGHKRKLLEIKKGKILLLPQKKASDLRILEYMQETGSKKEMDYREALVMAMKREKGSFKLYSGLAELAQDDSVRGTLLIMAQEEARHKLRFEIEYDEQVYKED